MTVKYHIRPSNPRLPPSLRENMAPTTSLALFGLFISIFGASIAERRVFPLIFNGQPPWHPFGRYYRARGNWVDTSGRAKFCNGHVDCYDLREPDEWCPLRNDHGEMYGEIGCFCDYHLNRCVIERQTDGHFQYADCSPKAISKCNW